MKHDAWSIIREKNHGKWISEHWACHANVCSYCSVWWHRPTKTAPGKCFNEKKTKNRENKDIPQPQKKGFQWKKRPTHSSKKKVRKNTCRPRTTEETYKPLKILEIALAKETKTTILEGLLGAITRSPKANPDQQTIFFFKYFLTSHQLLIKYVRIHFAMLCGHWFALEFLLCLPFSLVSCQKSDW